MNEERVIISFFAADFLSGEAMPCEERFAHIFQEVMRRVKKEERTKD